MNRLFYYSPVVIILSLFFLSCNDANTKPSSSGQHSNYSQNIVDISIPGSFNPESKTIFDSLFLNEFIDSFPQFRVLKKDLQEFYKKRNFSYAWYDESGIIEPALNLYSRVLNLKEEGLPDKVLYKNELIALMESNENNKQAFPQLELMLTSQYLCYAKFAWSGLSKEKLVSMDWFLPRKETSSSSMLDSILNGKDLLTDVPVFYQYELLKKYLKKYFEIQSKGGWDKIPEDKKNYIEGDTSSAIKAIKKHLYLTGDLEQDYSNKIFDTSLTVAIKNFQSRSGLMESGLINADLIKELNIPVEKRIEQLIVNMERCRWIPVSVQRNFILINIPDFKLHIYENDTLAWSMKIVVGKNQTQTAIFSGDLKYVVFSPYWNVPYSILKNEILPAIKKNPNYLAKHNMEWNEGSVRQLPGTSNSLGLVKFLFPNSHSIYLHDTPSKSLFEKEKRAFSHGCIRLAEPKKLAMYLLRDDPEWTSSKINEAMNRGVEKFVALKKSVPVYISYFTCWVDKKGNLQFRDDVYKRDERLLKMILDKPSL